MIAFFFTMPTSITMPIMAMTDRSIRNSISVEQRADAGRRQAGDDRDRVDEALVQDAEHHVGGEDRRQHQHALPFQRFLEHLRGALEAGGDRRPAGRASRSICWMASTACPSEKPGARLNEIVTAGCWPWWLTCSGPTDGHDTRASPTSSGTRCRARLGGLDDRSCDSADDVGLEFRLALQDDLVVVGRRVDRRRPAACRRR